MTTMMNTNTTVQNARSTCRTLRPVIDACSNHPQKHPMPISGRSVVFAPERIIAPERVFPRAARFGRIDAASDVEQTHVEQNGDAND
jgi:hypothetical protein